MLVKLLDQPFNPWTELGAYQERLERGRYGACVSFVGTMRDFNQGQVVEAMFLEHYPGMTERELGRILEEARSGWGFLDALAVHRVGEIRPGDAIVLVAVWSAHRGPAFDACRFIVEALKTRAPFWKKERSAAGVRWVEQNPG